MAEREEHHTHLPRYTGIALLMGAAIAVVAAIFLGGAYVIPILVLAVVCIVAALVYRGVSANARTEDSIADSSDSVPKLPADDRRPLGDTTEAHDELDPHDLPKDNPARRRDDVVASDEGALRRGMAAGGAGGTDRFRREREDLRPTERQQTG